MKVLLVSRDCQLGGVEAFTAALAETLAARGVRCELFFLTHGPMAQHLPAGVPVHFGDLGECIKFINAHGFDVVHGHSSDWQHGIAALRSAGAKLILTAHGWVVPDWDSSNCDGFVCCSAWQAEAQRVFTDLPLYTVLNGIDTEKFQPHAAEPTTGPPIIAWVGRGPALVQKRIDKLAAIAPALRAAGFRLWIADPYGPEAVAEVAPEAASVLQPRAEFWAGVAREDMPDFFRQVAASGGCLLSTASFEGLPLALAEAQACGCPVIGPDVRGVNEVIDTAGGGVLYPFELAAEQLAQLVLTTVGDTDGMRWRREACVRYARERFNLERMADDYERIYAEVLRRRQQATASPRRRAWLQPLRGWREYVARRWPAGRCQYETSLQLAAQGEGQLASAVARMSLATCPTLYLRPQRLAQLLRILAQPRAIAKGAQPIK